MTPQDEGFFNGKNMSNNKERYIAAKFGGWSLANAERTGFAMDYVRANTDIHFVVPSAPGSVNDGDRKVTDSLIDIVKARRQGSQYQAYLGTVYTQFTGISQSLGYHDMGRLLNNLEQGIHSGQTDAWVISRGEAINGKMWADLLDFSFVDPTEIIRFRKDGQLDERSYAQIGNRLRGAGRFVIPGFYGLGADGLVRTFPRDGSDVTGAVVARGVNAGLYQNLTSAEGVLTADPRVVKSPAPELIEELTFEEYRELGNAGIKVLHRDTIVPVARLGIPINVRHSLMPESRGTMVVAQRSDISGRDVIGVAGRSGFVSLNIHKFGMNDEKGIEGSILNIIRKAGISIDHVPSGNDRLSVVFNDGQFGVHEDEIRDKIQRRIRPQSLELQDNVGILSVVGQGIRTNRERVSRRLLGALEDASIECHGATMALSGLSIILFIDGQRVDDAVRAAHKALIK